MRRSPSRSPRPRRARSPSQNPSRTTRSSTSWPRPASTAKTSRKAAALSWRSGSPPSKAVSLPDRGRFARSYQSCGQRPALPEETPMTTLPLSHISVLDLTAHRAGPTAVRQLADWGAHVIKIEAPASEGTDATGSSRHGFDLQNLHRNKKAMTLNLKTPEG